ncbi:SDR family oxidoreductase [Microbacterium sp. 2FI]|uniref:SDR family oxidoreductase n=1 Tax=Microbacterium sp. 2FI TaxID=2502193 RepID=UPI0010F9B8E2|nr:SDR family oxidoreductase [Microbacterium sp. 2FI]
MTRISRAVLVTGCSTGIGRETARLFARRGWTVYATARRVEAIADLEASGCRTLALDVTDESSRVAAVETVVRSEGAVGVLVNNAGVSELGATATLPVDHVARMFETNVFAMLSMTQLALPGMRAQRWGRIVSMGSMNGRWMMPGMGSYAATKHAMEALTDALRYELRPLGIGVSLIAPGMVTTGFGHTAAGRSDAASADGALADFNERIAEMTRNWDTSPQARLACSPSDVAERVVRAAEARRPRARYRVAPSAALMLSLRRVLPERAFELVLRTQFPSPRQGR